MTLASLIVSIHDISPFHFHPVQRQVNEMARLGVKRMSLLVIPRHRDTGSLDQHPALVGWLRRWQEEGHEIVLHGWRHALPEGQMKSPIQGRLRRWFYEELYTAREAEFFALDRASALRLVEQGLSAFSVHGLHAQGFVAPAWLLNSQVEEALRDAGLLYTTTRTEIVHLPSRARFPATSCVWSTRAAWRRGASLLWNARLARRLAAREPMRVGIHPTDLDSPKVWRQVRRIVSIALEHRRPTTYLEWITAQTPRDKEGS
ncbi:MAG: DUF2334 domain-containing protein [Verrucomicrobiae bacterium]|nr:DUF2334 domain-containing protein [Verrucomicrobiae bacterium]